MSKGGVHGVDPVIVTDSSGNNPCCMVVPPNPCYAPGYPTGLQMVLTSIGAFCPCGDGTTAQLVYVGFEEDPALGGSDEWDSTMEGQPPLRWGDCLWTNGSGSFGPARFSVRLLLPHSGSGKCIFHLEVKYFTEYPSGNYIFLERQLYAMAKLSDNPLSLVTGLTFRDFTRGPNCGQRFGLPTNAQMRVDITGPPMPIL
jgi:hypothetical protein